MFPAPLLSVVFAVNVMFPAPPKLIAASVLLIVPPILLLLGAVATTPPVKVILSPASFPSVSVPVLLNVTAFVIVELCPPAPALNARFTATAGVERACAVSPPFTVVEPPVNPLKSSVPLPRFTTPSVFVPEPVNTKLQFAGPGISNNVMAPLPLLRVQLPVNVIFPAVPRLMGAFVVLMVPARLFAPTVFVTPPVNVNPASIVKLPVLLKVTAFVILPPFRNRTLYPCAAVFRVPIVTAP